MPAGGGRDRFEICPPESCPPRRSHLRRRFLYAEEPRSHDPYLIERIHGHRHDGLVERDRGRRQDGRGFKRADQGPPPIAAQQHGVHTPQRRHGITTKTAITIETLTSFQMASAGERKTNGTFCRDVGSHFITSWPVDSHATNWPRWPLLTMPSSVYLSLNLTKTKAFCRGMRTTSMIWTEK